MGYLSLSLFRRFAVTLVSDWWPWVFGGSRRDWHLLSECWKSEKTWLLDAAQDCCLVEARSTNIHCEIFNLRNNWAIGERRQLHFPSISVCSWWCMRLSVDQRICVHACLCGSIFSMACSKMSLSSCLALIHFFSEERIRFKVENATEWDFYQAEFGCSLWALPCLVVMNLAMSTNNYFLITPCRSSVSWASWSLLLRLFPLAPLIIKNPIRFLLDLSITHMVFPTNTPAPISIRKKRKMSTAMWMANTAWPCPMDAPKSCPTTPTITMGSSLMSNLRATLNTQLLTRTPMTLNRIRSRLGLVQIRHIPNWHYII